MTRMATSGNPESEIAKLVKRIERLENQNRLNNAEVSGTIRFHGEAVILLQGPAQISAGDYTLSGTDFIIPWGAASHVSMRTVLDAIDGRARAARERADDAHDRVDTVSARATDARDRAIAAQNTANEALAAAGGGASQGQVDALDAQLTAMRAEHRQKINQIIAHLNNDGPVPSPITG